MRIEGTEEGMSLPGTQSWIPKKSYPKVVVDKNSPAHVAFHALLYYMKHGVLRVLDKNGERIRIKDLPRSSEKLGKFLKGKTIILAGEPATGEQLTEIVNQYKMESKAAWKNVSGASASMGLVDRVGHKGSKMTPDQVQSKGFPK